MRLVLVELSRFFSRRAVVLLILAAALLTALVAGTTIWDSRPVSADETARAEAQVQQTVSSPQFKRDLRECEQDPADFFGPGGTSADCAPNLTPSAESYLNRSTLSLDEERGDSGIAIVVIVTVLMIIAGTTFAGADWASGSMSNQLLFEPRRQRVWWAKAVAAFLGTGLSALVLVVAFWLALSLTAESRGIHTGATVQEAIRWLAGRGVLLAAVAGLGGFALTMLVRHTVGTLAILFAYAAGGEALLALLPVERPGRFSPASNVFAWVRDGVRVFDPSVTCTPTQQVCEQQFRLSLAHGATYLGILLVLAMGLSLLSFARRDVP
jgi:ABC-2 type transport system permease protein